MLVQFNHQRVQLSVQCLGIIKNRAEKCPEIFQSLFSIIFHFGVKDFAGADLAAASNNYAIAITIKS